MLNLEVYQAGMIRLTNFFKKESVSDCFLEDYYIAISELSETAFDRAVNYLIKHHNSGFFPVPSQFLEAVKNSRDLTPVYTPPEKQIEMKYTGCPPEIKKQIEAIMERIKKRGAK